MANPKPLKIEGLAGLQRGFRKIDKNIGKEIKQTLREAAEPVRRDAEVRALRQIRNIGPKWSRMRTGVTTHVTYVAPKTRTRSGSSYRRPNLASLLMDKAMAPALEAHRGEIEEDIGEMLDKFFKAWERY